MKKIEEELKYCLNCKNKPCKQGCPLGNDIPEVIKLINDNQYYEAYNKILETTVLPSICGRICPNSDKCRSKCVRGINGEAVDIGKIESYIGDLAIEKGYKISKQDHINKKVAVIGGGPCGLTCAAYLTIKGYEVTIYEKNQKLGGIMQYGIPEFRLDKGVLNKTIQQILDLGIEVKNNIEIGKDIKFEEIKNKYDAVFVSVGANESLKMGINGENFEEVLGANELLEKNNHPNYVGKNIVVVGGGNVAIDCARVIKKLGAKNVKIIYRRSEQEMPAEKTEIEKLKRDDIEILFQVNLLKIIGEDHVKGIECIKTELIKSEKEERLIPKNIEGSNFLLKTDYIVLAIGSKPNSKIMQRLNLEVNNNYIKVDEKYLTSDSKVFAGGDIINTKHYISWAARNGRDAAVNIDNFFKK